MSADGPAKGWRRESTERASSEARTVEALSTAHGRPTPLARTSSASQNDRKLPTSGAQQRRENERSMAGMKVRGPRIGPASEPHFWLKVTPEAPQPHRRAQPNPYIIAHGIGCLLLLASNVPARARSQTHPKEPKSSSLFRSHGYRAIHPHRSQRISL